MSCPRLDPALTLQALLAAAVLLVSCWAYSGWRDGPVPLGDEAAVARFQQVTAPYGEPRVHGVHLRTFTRRTWVDGPEVIRALEEDGQSDVFITCVTGRPFDVCFRTDGSVSGLYASGLPLGDTVDAAAAKGGLHASGPVIVEREAGIVVLDRGRWRDKGLVTLAKESSDGVIAVEEQLDDRADVRDAAVGFVEGFNAAAAPVFLTASLLSMLGALWVLPFLRRVSALRQPHPWALASVASIAPVWEGDPVGATVVWGGVLAGWLVLDPTPARPGDLRRTVVRGSAWASLSLLASSAVHRAIQVAGGRIGPAFGGFQLTDLLEPFQAGIFEELWFRAVLIGAPLALLRRRFVVPIVLCSIAVFAGLHVSGDYLRDPWWLRLIDTSVMAAIYTAAAWRHGVAAAVWAHVVFNLLAFESWGPASMPCAILAFGALWLAAVWPTPTEPRPRVRPLTWW